MFNSNKDNWYREVKGNNIGRDFIIGDLHGYYSLLMTGLKKVDFDFSKDRLFSVGDLVDRGPEPLECLNLLKEKWFYPVMGNHEYMLLSSLGQRLGLLNTIQSFLYTDRRKRNKEKIHFIEYLKLINDMPIVIKVNDNKIPFYIIHAARPIKNDIIWDDNIFDVHKNKSLRNKYLKQMLWGRKLSKQAMLDNNILHTKHLYSNNENNLNLNLDLINDRYPFEKSSSVTYSGHTIMDKIVFHRSHIFIDGGRYRGGDLRIIEHNDTIEKIVNYQGKGGIIPSSCDIGSLTFGS